MERLGSLDILKLCDVFNVSNNQTQKVQIFYLVLRFIHISS